MDLLPHAVFPVGGGCSENSPYAEAFHAGLVPGGYQLVTAQAELTGRLKLVQLPSLHPLKYPVLFQFPCVETYL